MECDFKLECLGFYIVNGHSPCIDILEDLTIHNHIALVRFDYGCSF